MSSFPCVVRSVTGAVRSGMRWATGWWTGIWSSWRAGCRRDGCDRPGEPVAAIGGRGLAGRAAWPSRRPGGGAQPGRSQDAMRSATMIVGRLVLAEGIIGITDASAT